MPIKQFIKKNNKWFEKKIKITSANNFEFVDKLTVIKNLEKKIGINLSHNQKIIEFSPLAYKYLNNISKKINTFKGIFNSLHIEIEIFQSNHRGPGNARNIGIINSKNDWISFLDSVDLWSEDKIYHVKNTINNSSNTNFIVHC